ELRSKILLQRYNPARGIQYNLHGNDVVTTYYNDEICEEMQFNADVAVLATPFPPESGNTTLGPLLKVPMTSDGYFLEAHVKLRPLDFATDGIFLAGSAQYPKSAFFAQMTATGAAGRAVRLLAKGYVETEGINAEVDQSRCIGCTSCVNVCAFGAIQLQDVQINLGTEHHPRYQTIKKAYIVPASCKGCGTCVVMCPKKAISQHHFADKEILKMIEVFRSV
ncbi:MAG TPA: 4Fe-4S binding protein, partial [Candidatus Lokiarchaeia archaeon]|nr:4Fe-4S binding protein [Candidatus Lokiarchaeia archaeon]